MSCSSNDRGASTATKTSAPGRTRDTTELLASFANFRLRETSPGVFRMDHDAAGHDVRAIALALAASKLLERPASGGNAELYRDVGPPTGTVGITGTFGYDDRF